MLPGELILQVLLTVFYLQYLQRLHTGSLLPLADGGHSTHRHPDGELA